MTTIQESAGRVAKGMTPYPSKHLVLEAVHSFTSSRFGKVEAGEEGAGSGRKTGTKPASVKQESSSEKLPMGSFA